MNRADRTRVRSLLAWGIALGAFLGFASAPQALAEVPHLIRYQGQAVDEKKAPLEGPYTLTFRLYSAETGGIILWEEPQTVQLTEGHFSVLLGQENPLNGANGVDWSEPCWLSVQVNDHAELTPRQRITSVPLAIRAQSAEVVKTSGLTDDANLLVPSSAIILWDGATCPTGYTRVSSYDDRFLVGSPTAGTPGGKDTHDHGGTTDSHTLTIAQIPSHTHTVVGRRIRKSGSDNEVAVLENTGDADKGAYSEETNAIGGGGGHTHPISSADHRPAFKTILLCQKD